MKRRPNPPRRRAPNRYARTGVARAIAALLAPSQGPTGEAALAERDQLHRDAQRSAQQELRLRRGDA